MKYKKILYFFFILANLGVEPINPDDVIHIYSLYDMTKIITNQVFEIVVTIGILIIMIMIMQ